MGLSERKVKQRIGLDPRNLTWSNDQERFSYKHLKTLGWEDNTGLGSTFTGNANHIAVVRKSDNGGIGMARAVKDNQDLAAGAGQAGQGLEDVLKRLASASSTPVLVSPLASPAPSPAPEERSAVMRNRIASRQKHLTAKRMASQSAQAMAEILGVPVSSLPASPLASGSSTPQPETKPDVKVEADEANDDGRNAEETISTSKLSVSDYFRQKMREKMLARQGSSASSSSTPAETPKYGLDSIKDEVKTEWEGSKVTFEPESQTGFNPSESTGEIPKEDIEKEKKRQRKEEKRLAKLAKEALERDSGKGKGKAKDPIHEAHVKVEKFEHAGEKEEKEEKKKRKEEKKRRKEEKSDKEVEVKVEKVEVGVEAPEKKRKRHDEEEGGKKSKKEKKEKEGKVKKEKKEKSVKVERE